MKATQRQRTWRTLPQIVRRRLPLAGVVSILILICTFLIPVGERRSSAALMKKASLAMAETLKNIPIERTNRGLGIDPIRDPNLTGLIGIESSSMTSTLGHLGAKRTTTNPNFAGLIAHLLLEAGIQNGNTVAICASGSFPALLLATLHAVESLGASPLLIPSLSASMYGANEEAFTLLDVLDGYSGGELELLAASVGGGDDRGSGLDTRTVTRLESVINARSIRLISPSFLQDAVSQRMLFFDEASNNREIGCFVNVGGSWVSMGTDSDILKIPPGLTTAVDDLPLPSSRGMIFEFLARGVPIIHLLNIHDLSTRYALPWDPMPLPAAGEGSLYYSVNKGSVIWIWPAVVWLLFIGILLAVPSREKRTNSPLRG
jgi:poly-gamma-glutamate system protein